MSKVLILGASGLVGKALVSELSGVHDVYGTYFSKKVDILGDKAYRLDVEDIDNIRDILGKVKPEIVISCLRGDFDKQIEVHREAANYLKEIEGKLYYCSTANVFDGSVDSPHDEGDKTKAESDYGQFKIKCEEELVEILGENVCLLRLPMIWGRDSIRLNSLLEKLNKNEKIEVYTNLYFTNNTDYMLAKQIHYIVSNSLKGIFHLATKDVINHYDFMLELIKRLGYVNPELITKTLQPEKYYLAVISKRHELPEELMISTKGILEHLTSE